MIPTVDDSYETYSTKDKKSNAVRNDSNVQCQLWPHGMAACAETDGNQIDKTFHSFASRTDKPRLAHEVFFQWLSIPSLNDDNVTSKLKLPFAMTQKDLLIAAYSGPSIMYRK